jgi:hypothetical protein
MSESYLKMKANGGSERLVKNIAKRVKTLENKLGIPAEDSIVEEEEEEEG